MLLSDTSYSTKGSANEKFQIALFISIEIGNTNNKLKANLILTP